MAATARRAQWIKWAATAAVALSAWASLPAGAEPADGAPEEGSSEGSDRALQDRHAQSDSGKEVASRGAGEPAASWKAPAGLELAVPGRGGPTVVLVSGAVADYKALAPYVEALGRRGAEVWGFTGNAGPGESPMGVDYMEDNAKILAAALEALAARGTRKVAVAGACVGALVALRAAALSKGKFEALALTAVSAPLGGFALALPADWLPGHRWAAKALGFALAADVAPTSDFLRSLAEPLPKEVDALLANSPDDTVTSPELAMGKDAFERNRKAFGSEVSFESGGDHMAALDIEALSKQGVDIVGLVMGERPKELRRGR